MPRQVRNFSLAVALLGCASAVAAPPSRLSAAIDARGTELLRGSVRPQLRSARDSGRLDGAAILHGVSLDVRLSPAQQADLDQLLREQQDPLSRNYHGWLTPQQYGERFGLSAQDLGRVEAWLRGQGLSVDGVESGGNHIRFSGSVAHVEAAFQTELHRYSVDGESHFANAAELALPTALSGMVLGVRGLDDFRPRPHVRPAPAFTSSISGNNFLSPGDIATIYDIGPLYSAGITGSGHKIAVVGQTAINLSDVHAFRSAAGLPVDSAHDPQFVVVPGTGSAGVIANGTDDMTESDIDVEWTGGVAKDAAIVFVYTGSNTQPSGPNVFDALKYAIDKNLAPVISISYGNCESGNSGVIDSVESWFMQAGTQGQTIVASSGDAGAADCDTTGSATASHGLAVDYPASSPEVTGIGGAEFNEGSSTSSYWKPKSSTDVISSALSYIPETAWNDTGKPFGSSSGPLGLSASGGGRSSRFTKPSWQTGAGVPGDNARYVPDLALAASAVHDGYLYCTTDKNSHGTCVNGFRNNDAQTTLTVAGGTSLGAPVFAGMLTLVENKAGLSGVGNANPQLYQFAASTTAAAFHDIVSGNNNVPTSSGGTIGYSAGPGYDPVTGLGSIDVGKLAQAWAGSGSSSSGSSSSSSSSSSSGSSSGGSSTSSSSSSSSSSSGSASSSSSSSSSSSGASGSGSGGGGGGAWAPLPLLLLSALAALRRRRF